jgi:hypothetical protein
LEVQTFADLGDAQEKVHKTKDILESVVVFVVVVPKGHLRELLAEKEKTSLTMASKEEQVSKDKVVVDKDCFVVAS